MPARPVRPVPVLVMLGALAVAVALVASSLLVDQALRGAAVAAGNPATPGTFTGKGFDQCNAPSQKAMSAWRRSSPYRSVGIYISGNSRFCREQANLTPTWVSTQLAAGWHLLPITLGPQAHCQPRFPRYGKNIDPTIYPRRADTYAKARAQAADEAGTAIAAAQRLGIVPGSTLFYDLEGFDLQHSVDCTWSAAWFLSTWSNELHAAGYLSGVYSGASSGIALLDRIRLDTPTGFVLPDQVWLARWDKKKNTSAPGYLTDDGWADRQRVKQYVGGHDETWGGVRINIDRDYLDLRARPVPAPVAEPPGPTPTPTPTAAPTPTPAPTATPKPAPGSMVDARCTTSSISRTSYRRTDARHHLELIAPLQCLLKQQHLYTGAVTGRWDARTVAALRRYQALSHRPQRNHASRSDWVRLLSAGAEDRVLRARSAGADVIRLQRALNAATGDRLRVTGHVNTATRTAIRRYQHKVLGHATGVVASQTWHALHGGRW